MKLVNLFNTLTPPDEENQKVFNAILIPDFPNFRIAVDNEGHPVLLLAVNNQLKFKSLKNFRLKYLLIQQNLECKISEYGKQSYQCFTAITFTSNDKELREYFLRVSESFLKVLKIKPSQEEILETVDKLVEIFRLLSDAPTNTVHGLWSELFLIEISKNPKALLNFWHNSPEEKFDFNSGLERIEVKSSSSFQRIHTFSSEQLNPREDSQVLIASIFLKPHTNGLSIQELSDSILDKVGQDIVLSSKLNNVIFKTLANSLEQSVKIKFDYNIAKDSVKFYRHQDIIKIEEIYIPDGITEVHYKSDLTDITPIGNELLLERCGELFRSI